MTAPPPFRDPVVVNDRRVAFLPDAHIPDQVIPQHIYTGCGLGWAPMRRGHVLLNIAGSGRPLRSTEPYSAVAFTLSPAGLRALIADLQAIADQRDGEGLRR